jgi:MFS family permease
MTVLAAGGLLGALTVGIFGQAVTRRRSVFRTLGSVAGGALAALISVPHLLTAISAVFLIGLTVSYLQVSATTWLQHVTPPNLLGRIMGLLAMR